MFVTLVVTTFHHLSSMRLVLLLRRIGKKSNIVVDVKIEQRPRFSAGLIDDEVVESVVLSKTVRETPQNESLEAYMGYDEILLML